MRRFAAALLPRLFGKIVPGHTTRAPPVGFEPGANGIQFYDHGPLQLGEDGIERLGQCQSQFRVKDLHDSRLVTSLLNARNGPSAGRTDW